MPATEFLFADFLPARLYLDTDILISYLIRTQPHHERCRIFLERIAAEQGTTIFLSSLSWLEYLYVVSRENFRNALPDDMRLAFQLERWHRAHVRQAYLRDALDKFDALLDQYEVNEVLLGPDIRALALDLAIEHNLGSQDAVHLASALSAGITDFASLDRGFRRVSGIRLWNDLIYTGRTRR